jgi:MFS family permease
MHESRRDTFYGWRVVSAAFVLAVFGLGMGFHGPAVYLHAIHGRTGWPLALVSAAVTVHFLVGAMVVANLPELYRRFGIPTVTKAGAISLAVGVFGWAIATAPWQLFAATLLSGAGWVTMGVAAINAIVAPWFIRGRPAALAMAYNGGNIGGVVFSPLWAAAIGAIGFPAAAAAIGLAMAITMWVLAGRVFSRTPQQMRLVPDGDALGARPASVTSSAAKPLPGSLLWRDLKFLTLAAGMALGLFAQIGLIVHLFSLLVPALGATRAGLAMGLVTAMAIIGRSLIGWAMPADIDRRLVASAEPRRTDRWLRCVYRGGGHQRAAIASCGRPVWHSLRQRNVVAASDCPGRICRGRCATRGRPHCSDLTGNVRFRPGGIRHDQRAHTAFSRRGVRQRSESLCCCRNCPRARHLCVSGGSARLD